jgi:hypothetical protein
MLFKRKLDYVFLRGMLVILGLLGVARLALAQGDTWITKTPMPTARTAMTTSVIGEKIYIIGGQIRNNAPGLKTVEI